MRKFSKLLAVLLTLCLLSGVVVSFVASAGTDPLNITENALNYVTDFSTKNALSCTSSSYGVGVEVVHDKTAGIAKMVHADVDLLKTDQFPLPRENELATGKYDEGIVDGETNDRVISITDKNGVTTVYDLRGTDIAKRPFGHSITHGAAYSPTLDQIKNNKIVAMVFEFDFGVDSNRYSYTNGNGKKVYSLDLEALKTTIANDTTLADETAKANAIAEAETSAELAMYEDSQGMTIYLEYADEYSTDSKKVTNAAKKIWFHKVGTEWYISNAEKTSDVNKMFKLSNQVGVLDRYSFVWSFKYNEDGSVTASCNFYLNGEFCFEIQSGKTMSVSGATKHGAAFRRMYFAATADDYCNMHFADTYSLAFDNAAANYYTEDDLKTYGLRGTSSDLSKYVETNGMKYYFTVEGAKALASSLTNGSKAKIGMDLAGFAPSTELSHFYIDLDNDATVTLSSKTEAVFDAYLFDEANDIYLYVNNGQLNDISATDDVFNRGYNSFVASSVRLVHDGTHTTGIGDSSTTSLSYFRIYRNTGVATQSTNSTMLGVVMTSWDRTAAKYKGSNLFDTSFAVLDFDFGSDRYVFSYTAKVEVVKNITSITENNVAVTPDDFKTAYPDAYKEIAETETVEMTVYKTVESRADFEKYCNNPSLLVNETQTYQNYYGTSYSAYDAEETKHTFVLYGTRTETVKEVVSIDEEQKLDVALYEGMTIRGYMQEQSKSKFDAADYDERRYPIFFTVVKGTDGLWYLSTDNKYGGNDVLLSNEVGVTDHITIVFENATDEHTIKYHSYVNGEYVTSAYLSSEDTGSTTSNGKKYIEYDADDADRSATSNYLAVSFRGFGVGVRGSWKHLDAYSAILDNTAINWYRSDVTFVKDGDTDTVATASYTAYSSGDAYGIDDLIADLKAGIINPIYNCTDVVYNTNYKSGSWITVDNFQTIDYIPGVAVSKLNAENNTLITNNNISNVKPAVDSFTFKPFDASAKISFMAPYIAKANNDGTYACSKITVGTQANVDLKGGMAFNLYIPNTLTNIKVNGKALEDSANNAGYQIYTWTTSADSFEVKTVIVTATYTEGGVDYTINVPVTLDVVKYASYLAANENADYKTLAKELVDYKVAAAEYTSEGAFDASGVASVSEFYTAYGTIADATYAENTTAATGDVKLGYAIDNLGKLSVVINSDSETAPVVKYVIYSKSGAKKLTITPEVTGEAGAWIVEDVDVAFIDSVFTVTVGETTSTYSLYNYASESQDAAAKTFAEALLQFAAAAKSFKVITE